MARICWKGKDSLNCLAISRHRGQGVFFSIIFNFILKFTHHQIIAFIMNAWIVVMYFDEICLCIKIPLLFRFSRVHLTTSHPISFGSHAAYIGLPQVALLKPQVFYSMRGHNFMQKFFCEFFLLVFNILGHFFSFELNICQVRIMHLPCPSKLHLTAWAEFEKMKEEECVHISEKLIFRSFRCNFWQELKEQ